MNSKSLAQKIAQDIIPLSKDQERVYLDAYEEYGDRGKMISNLGIIFVSMLVTDGCTEDEIYDKLEDAIDDFIDQNDEAEANERQVVRAESDL